MKTNLMHCILLKPLKLHLREKFLEILITCVERGGRRQVHQQLQTWQTWKWNYKHFALLVEGTVAQPLMVRPIFMEAPAATTWLMSKEECRCKILSSTVPERRAKHRTWAKGQHVGVEHDSRRHLVWCLRWRHRWMSLHLTRCVDFVTTNLQVISF
jgi:hypothetical protein